MLWALGKLSLILTLEAVRWLLSLPLLLVLVITQGPHYTRSMYVLAKQARRRRIKQLRLR